MLGQCILRPGGYDGSVPISWYAKAKEAFEKEFSNYLESQA
jgi:hypothetical protein